MLTRQSIFKSVIQRVAYSSCFDVVHCIVRTDNQYRYKYNFGITKDELYDLNFDPAEKMNLIDQHPELISERKKDLFRWYTTSRSQFHNFVMRTNPRALEDYAETVTKLESSPAGDAE